MTIYQSRYGANAEVGRNPSRKPVKDQSAALTFGTAGLAGTGAGIYGYGAGSLGRHNARIAQAKYENRAAKRDLTAAERHLKALKGVRNTTVKNKRNMVQEYQILAAEEAIESAQQRKNSSFATAHNLSQKSPKVNLRAAKFKRAGKLTGAVGLAGLAASLYATERARGTFGYKRPKYPLTQGM